MRTTARQRRIAALFLAALLAAPFMSCSLQPSVIIAVPNFRTRAQANYWVHNFIQYKDVSRLQSIQTTYTTQRGKCEDYATLLMYVLHFDFGDNPVFIGTAAAPGGHAVVLDHGKYYDPTAGAIEPKPLAAVVLRVPYRVMMAELNMGLPQIVYP